MKNFFRYFKSAKVASIVAPIFKLFEVAFELCVPLVVAKIINQITNKTASVSYVVYACLFLFALAVAGFVCALVAQYFAAKSAVNYSKNLRHDLFEKIENLSFSQIDKLNPEKLIVRMTNDTAQIQNGINLTLRLLLRSPLVVFGAMVLAFVLNAFMGMVFAITISILCVIVFTILLVSIKKYKAIQNGLEEVTASTRQNLKGTRVLRAFCKEEDEIHSFEKNSCNLYKKQISSSIISELLNPLTFAIINIAIIVVLQIGAFKFNEGTMSVGTIVALYNYMAQILVELIKFANLMITISKTIASYKRVNEILNMDTKVEVFIAKNSKKSKFFIEFKNVSMNYDNVEKNSLSNISFAVEKGEIVGVVGATGSGKSTLVNLMLKFYDANTGEIYIKNTNINDFSKKQIREICAVVQQKVALFHGTIKENIIFGSDASNQDLQQAVAVAQANSVIDSKSNGLDEMVEEGGKNFSLGQKQRLTIARALVKKPEILILDDATSALDNITQNNLINDLKALKDKPTTFIVTQRINSVSHVNKIIVLENGNMVGFGKHKDLLKSCPLYKELFEVQTGVAK